MLAVIVGAFPGESSGRVSFAKILGLLSAAALGTMSRYAGHVNHQVGPFECRDLERFTNWLPFGWIEVDPPVESK